ncbi:MAG: hypothetical protein KUL82_01615 [Bdellovibrio sp.]|nr:hypothetical protein [Bdellovibrio sp.]
MKTLVLILTMMTLSATGTSWAQVPAHQTSLLSPLHFTNRAQCALDSEKPTSSIFVMIDGYNAGKTANSIAKLRGLNTEEYSNKAMKEFRLSVAYMTLNVMNKLVRGHLPLLPANLKTADLPKYLSASNNCETKNNNCADVSNYIAQIWSRAGQRSEILNFDRFTQNNFPLHASKDRLGCYYIKKFSPLQGQLHNAEVTQANLQDVAVAYLNEKDYLTGCFDADDKLNNRFVTLQIDWETNQSTLNQQGFDFWNSVKIYLSWAWRNTNELEIMSPSFGRIFKSIALEESILLVPNGCKSMTKPSCDSQYLSSNSIRELAKVTGAQNSELFDTVPVGTDAELLEKGVRGVNNDFLGTQSFDSAQEWLSNFRKNVVQSRGLMKTKYQNAITHLNILQDQIGTAGLGKTVMTELTAHRSSENMMNELYYMCTEIRLAADDTLDFLKSDIERISQLKNMTQMQYSEKRSLNDHVEFFKAVSSQVLPYCNDLEKQNFWNKSGYTVNKSGFAPWAKEMLQLKDDEASKFTPSAGNQTPMLSWKNANGTPGQVICYNSVDCTRLMVKSMVDLYAVSTYADALIPLAGKTSDPNLFNPYSELATCKMYDPWFQTQRMNKVFYTDLANTALFGWNILPIYIDVNFSAPKVTSFKQLMQDGVIKYDPRLEKSKVERSIVADFGPLLGAPCAIALNNNGLKNYNFYSFTGVTMNYCDGKQANEVISNNPSDFANGAKTSRSFCAGCTLNFTAMASASSAATLGAFNPAKFVVYMFRTFNKYFSAKKDTVNIPKSWDVNAAYAAEVYKKYGQIPSYCVDQLGQGLKCFKDICASKAAAYFEKSYNTKVHSVYMREDENMINSTQKEAWIKSDLCQGETIVRFSCDERKLENFKVYSINGFHKSCRNAIGK